jgi:C-terminal processing protease CtpA/Prc
MAMDVIEEALALLLDRYIFPDRAATAAAAVRARREAGEYDGLDEVALADRLTAHLFEVCADKHLRVRVRSSDLSAEASQAEREAAWHEMMRLRNYGIARVERLPGNVGYVDLRAVAAPDTAAPAIAAAMALVAHTYSLIFDLRRNGGGSPQGVIFWNSYLFADDDVHLNSIYDGASGQTRPFYSLAWVPGERYLNRPVWVLTSDQTFSGAEEFAYNLKAQGRATIVGETTRGGAHPTDGFPLSGTLEITVPIARSVNPVTGTNWEGTGVEPDIAVPAERAYPLAYGAALRHVLATTAPTWQLTEAREALAGLDPADLDPTDRDPADPPKLS